MAVIAILERQRRVLGVTAAGNRQTEVAAGTSAANDVECVRPFLVFLMGEPFLVLCFLAIP